jgi:hypothetical protein
MTDQQYKTRFINGWKKRHNRKTKMGSRMMLAYNVPGTSEHGSLHMWQMQPASQFRPEKENPSIKKSGRTATLRNFSGTVTLRANGQVAITPDRKR